MIYAIRRKAITSASAEYESAARAWQISRTIVLISEFSCSPLRPPGFRRDSILRRRNQREVRRCQYLALSCLLRKFRSFSPLPTALPVNHLLLDWFARNCCFRYGELKGRENHIKCSANVGAEVIGVTVRRARARGEAEVPGADRCLGCKLEICSGCLIRSDPFRGKWLHRGVRWSNDSCAREGWRLIW